jgi:hypothetical protein
MHVRSDVVEQILAARKHEVAGCTAVRHQDMSVGDAQRHRNRLLLRGFCRSALFRGSAHWMLQRTANVLGRADSRRRLLV